MSSFASPFPWQNMSLKVSYWFIVAGNWILTTLKKPESSNEDVATSNQEPVTSNYQSSTGTQHPEIRIQKPETKREAPFVSFRELSYAITGWTLDHWLHPIPSC
jgi:hypothetical protein